MCRHLFTEVRKKRARAVGKCSKCMHIPLLNDAQWKYRIAIAPRKEEKVEDTGKEQPELLMFLLWAAVRWKKYWQDKHYGIHFVCSLIYRVMGKNADDEKKKTNLVCVCVRQRGRVKSMENIIEKRVPIFLIFSLFASPLHFVASFATAEIIKSTKNHTFHSFLVCVHMNAYKDTSSFSQSQNAFVRLEKAIKQTIEKVN